MPSASGSWTVLAMVLATATGCGERAAPATRPTGVVINVLGEVSVYDLRTGRARTLFRPGVYPQGLFGFSSLTYSPLRKRAYAVALDTATQEPWLFEFDLAGKIWRRWPGGLAHAVCPFADRVVGYWKEERAFLVRDLESYDTIARIPWPSVPSWNPPMAWLSAERFVFCAVKPGVIEGLYEVDVSRESVQQLPGWSGRCFGAHLPKRGFVNWEDYVLVLRDYQGSLIDELARFRFLGHTTGLVASPDGRWIAYSRTTLRDLLRLQIELYRPFALEVESHAEIPLNIGSLGSAVWLSEDEARAAGYEFDAVASPGGR